MKVKAANLKLLEKIFAAEIDGVLPYQSRSKKFEEMETEGLVERMTRTFGRDRLGSITVSGWALTHAGRIAYCESCADVELEDEDE